jgi:oligoribonuclease NrnB/cAMP/cGMP phosphodiesterase (DHH superfamily)
LEKHLLDLKTATDWLQHSYNQCQPFTQKTPETIEDFDKIEALTSRFARVSDILIQKVYRSIDKVELEEGGSLLDILNRSHKRNLFESIDTIREIRELRNEIAHDYSSSHISERLSDILTKTPALIDFTKKANQYCKNSPI